MMIGPSTTRAARAQSRITPTARWSAWIAAVVLAACGAGEPSAADASEGSDVTPPVFAGAASATGLASGIRLDWSPATDDRTRAEEIVYLVYEAEESGAQDLATPTFTTLPGATSYTVSPLPVSTTRYYIVRARDGAGNVDDNTTEVFATTLETADTTPPAFDGLMSAAPVGAHAALLSWVAATDDVSPPELIRYRAYLATAPGGQDFSSAAVETVPGATEVLVGDLSLETTYFFVVRAVDAAGNEDENTFERSATTAAGVSYAADVQPIFDASCAGAACHAGVMPSEGLDLSPAASYGQLVEVPAEQCAGRLRVAPGAPDQSYLVDKIRGTNLCAGSRMPKDSPLSPAEIQLVVDWIAAGAQND